MAIRDRDRKILWVRSGNQCAFPGCGQALVEKDTCRDGNVVIGQEAHIVARRPDGPRGKNVQRWDSVNSHKNIILLCPTHHRLIDQKPLSYTTDRLFAMKEAHEATIADKMMNDDHHLGMSNWIVGRSLVVIESFGCLPVWLGDRWQASGLSLGQQTLHHIPPKIHWLYTSSEAEPEVQYWSENHVVYLVERIVWIDGDGLVPFISHQYDFHKFPATVTTDVLVDIDASWGEQLPQLVQEVWSINRETFDEFIDMEARLDLLLFRIWKAGLVLPTAALAELKKMQDLWWFDGCMAEYVHYLSKQLVKVQRSLPPFSAAPPWLGDNG